MKTRYKKTVAIAGNSVILGNMKSRPTISELAMSSDFVAVRVLASQPISNSAEESADRWNVVGFTSELTHLTENLGFVIRGLVDLDLDVEVQVHDRMGAWVMGWYWFDTNGTLHVERDEEPWAQERFAFLSEVQ